MHIRINELTVAPTRVDELGEVLENKAVPVVLALPGCKGLLCSADRATGSCTIVSRWDSEQSLEASEKDVASIRSETVDAVEAQLDRLWIAEILREVMVSPSKVGSRVRVVRLRANAGSADQMVAFYDEEALPRLQSQAGFLSSRLIRDVADATRLAAVSHWADAAALEASDAGSAALRDLVAERVPGTSIEGVATAEIILAELRS
jgi:quinol monooxygenase YgiN